MIPTCMGNTHTAASITAGTETGARAFGMWLTIAAASNAGSSTTRAARLPTMQGYAGLASAPRAHDSPSAARAAPAGSVLPLIRAAAVLAGDDPSRLNSEQLRNLQQEENNDQQFENDKTISKQFL